MTNVARVIPISSATESPDDALRRKVKAQRQEIDDLRHQLWLRDITRESICRAALLYYEENTSTSLIRRFDKPVTWYTFMRSLYGLSHRAEVNEIILFTMRNRLALKTTRT